MFDMLLIKKSKDIQNCIQLLHCIIARNIPIRMHLTGFSRNILVGLINDPTYLYLQFYSFPNKK